MSLAIAVFAAAGFWFADRYIARLRRGKPASLITGRTYAALLFIGLIVVLLWG